ncbi:WAS/WASL-interacting protein family member 3-like isoform X2 [Nylanderia fulva]|uniref:WAS/WASL-interacting protein family member 3-like isoform X2 n=1 Tax=Nylanderia fulva TaxID=613905 RepID=UPI0010FB3A91|nr:WAS/WASL-interacting protein family member 3-like isoform X2 [Nylanderia fulva]
MRIIRMSVPPPPPPPQVAASGPPVADNRNLLLQSIRAGKTLKKTVTVDKSAPAIAGKIKGESKSPSLSSNNRTNTSNAAVSSSSNGGPMPLGGLFAGGMPKLKPTGLRGNMTEKEGQSVNVNNSSFLHSSPGSSHSIKRGPPPVPPPAAQKPQIFSQGQSTMDSTTSNSDTMPRLFAKSAAVPKPVPSSSLSKPSPPPKKLNLTSNVASVARAQSMRLPRSSPVLVTTTPSSLHQSQDCLHESIMPQPAARPTVNRVLRPPITRPPSPPISRTSSFVPATKPPSPPPSTSRSTNTRPSSPPPPPTTTTRSSSTMPVMRAAPPPPSRVTVTAPCIPPPPPPLPHRPAPTHQRLAPPPPPPPTPPTRSLSVRNGSGQAVASSVDLEMRFAEMFHTASSLPPPEPFKGFVKVYSSRNAAKQQAPAPPLQPSSTPSSLHSLNTSSGNKQWQQNATSLAY